ncbi:MAG: alpha-2-macroglobulin, partial [Bacteroidales bacterium]|nr:alpha-2-macroglobulin [Bacteroidales bacterium]
MYILRSVSDMTHLKNYLLMLTLVLAAACGRPAGKQAAVSIDRISISQDDPSVANVDGVVEFSSATGQEEAAKYIQASEGAVNISPGTDSSTVAFRISGIARADKDKKVTIGLRNGIKALPVKAVIPAKGEFRVVNAELAPDGSPAVRVTFSEPLKGKDAADFITISGPLPGDISIDANIADIFFDNAYDGNIDICVQEGLPSASGDRLKAAYASSLSAKGIKPAVELALGGSILPDDSNLVLPFKAVNLNAVDISIVQIFPDNILMFLQDNSLSDDNQLRRSGRLIYKSTIPLTGSGKDLHKWNGFSVDLSGLFKKEPNSIYRIRLSFSKDYSIYGQAGQGNPPQIKTMTAEDQAKWDYPEPWYYESFTDWDDYEWEDRDDPAKPTYYMNASRFPVCNLMTSDIGVIAKYASGDMVWVTATDIMSAKPLSGAQVKAYNFQLREIGSGKTGSDGNVAIKIEGKPFAIAVNKGNSTSYLKVTDGLENNLSRFDVGGKALEKGLKAFIYGERGVWRPGDTLHVTMLLQEKGRLLPEGHPVSLELYTPQGQFYTKQILTHGQDGFYTYAIPTSADDPTGIWNAWLKVGGAAFHKSLRVETVKPNRLKIDVKLADKWLASGKRTAFDVSSSWLTGLPASGLKAKATMTLTRSAGKFDGYNGYIFQNPTSDFATSETELYNVSLGPDGTATAYATLPEASDAPGMLRADIVESVEEKGGDASFTTQTIPFSPFDAYVGVKLPQPGKEGWLETDKDLDIEVVLVDPDGKKVSGHKLDWRIWKTDWSWWWENSSSEFDSYVNGSRSDAIAQGTITSGNGTMRIPFRVDYPDWGRYIIYVKDLDGGHASGGAMLIDWPSYRGRASKNDPNALTMISFSSDKDSYSVGETATVFVPAARGGQALVSIENAGKVLSQKWVSTKDEDTQYQFKVSEEMAPNFYVHITLLQPHSSSANDLPIRMYGVLPVSVENKGSHLNPVISMPDEVHPQEEFTIKVSEKDSKAMTYTLAIVDEGLLDLTSFKTPDPWNTMYAREALGVRTWDLFNDVIGAWSGRFSPMLAVGGDENIKIIQKKDNRFNPVVKFLGPFTLNSGTATHKVTLPMYVGSVRVMLVAGHDAAYGNAEKNVAVRNPLMILSSLPRVLSTGDEVEVPVNVFAMDKSVDKADVSISVEGPVKVTGPATASLTFSEPGDKIAGFHLTPVGEGTATITVQAASKGHKASETVTVNVRNPHQAVTYIENRTIAPGATATFTYDVVPGVEDRVSTTLSSFPAINFNGLYEWFSRYAYNCTEQLSARGMNIVYTSDYLSQKNRDAAADAVPRILKELYSRQFPDGGFAYWPGMKSSDSWATSMAGLFMTEAARKGYEVSTSVLSKWQSFQQNAARNFRKNSQIYNSDLDQAFRLYTLVVAGKPENSAMNRLKEMEGLSSQALCMLASAYALDGKKNIASQMLTAPAGKTGRDADVHDFTYGSSLRDDAIALNALALSGDTGAAIEMAGPMKATFTDGWYSSQDAAFASMALGNLASRTGTGNVTAEVNDNCGIVNVQAEGSSWASDVKPVGTLSIKNTSSGALYATLLRTHMPSASETVEAASNGLVLTTSYTDNAGNPVNPSSLTQGTDFTMTVKVSNPSAVKYIESLALTAMIPSGWEIYNERLFSQDELAHPQYNYNDIRDDRSIWYFDLPKGMTKTFTLRL